MIHRVVLVATFLLAGTAAHVVRDAVMDGEDDADRYAMPSDILWGAGISAIQTEGAWDVDGKV